MRDLIEEQSMVKLSTLSPSCNFLNRHCVKLRGMYNTAKFSPFSTDFMAKEESLKVFYVKYVTYLN